MFVTFLTILAWIGFVGGALLTAGRIWGAVSTTELDRAMAQYRGLRITHPIKLPATIATVSGAFLLAQLLS